MVTRLQEIENSARERFIPVILEESKSVLIKLVQELKPKRILEIGTAIGYSGTIMLSYSSKDTVLDTIEIDIERYEESKQVFDEFGFAERVNVYLGDAMDILKVLISKHTYDLIFIDGPKSKYNEYLSIVENGLNNDGVVFCDNVLFKGMVRSGKYPPHKHRTIVTHLRAFINKITDKTKYITTILEAGDGIAIIKRVR